jgi:hypothetical protein
MTRPATETLLFCRNFFQIKVIFTATFFAEKYHDDTLAIFDNLMNLPAASRGVSFN